MQTYPCLNIERRSSTTPSHYATVTRKLQGDVKGRAFKGLSKWETDLWCKVEQLKVVARVVQRNLTSHRDVGERLLQGKDVPTHLLDAALIDAVNVLRRTYQDFGN